MKLSLLFIISAALALGACKSDDSFSEPEYPAKDLLDIVYGDHSRQRMDVYFPDRYGKATPVVFLMHGGAFVYGSKDFLRSQAQMMRAQGFITVNISYRLVDSTGIYRNPPLRKASNVTIASQLDDIAAAVSKYRAEAPGWGAGSAKMYMAGHSAGAILAMLYTQGEKNKDGHIRASGNWAGLTDFSIPNDSAFAGIPEPPRQQVYELYWRISGAEPITKNNLAYMAISAYWVANLHGGRPNISIFPENNVIFGGGDERDYNLRSTQGFHKLLKEKAIPERLMIFEGSDHSLSMPADAWQRCTRETADFFRAN